MKWGLLGRPVTKSLLRPVPLIFVAKFLLVQLLSGIVVIASEVFSPRFGSFPTTLPQFDSKVRVDADVFDDGSTLGQDDFPIHYASYLANAVETGVKDATELYEQIEPALYKKSE